MKTFNKLVRDHIPEIIRKNGEIPEIMIASEEEYSQRLMEKLEEEVHEFFATPNTEEMADILEVLHALCNLKGFSWEQVEMMRQKKSLERGAFEKRIILKSTKKNGGE